MAGKTGKVVWLGNGVAAFMQPTKGGDPVPVGGEITLSQAQVTALEAAGHRFAQPGSDEAKEAEQQAVNTGQLSESELPK
jgi:hypothetical protein